MNQWLDKLAIGELINGWMYRDTGQWDNLLALFHPEGTIDVTWFEGRFTDFVAASREMQKSALSAKHTIGMPIIKIHHNKALAETNAVIVGENSALKLGANIHCRLFDYVEKRDNGWRILHRQVIYDSGFFCFPAGYVEIDKHIVSKYPLNYAPLGYLLETGGYPLKRVFTTKDSESEVQMRAKGEAWLVQ